MRALLFLLGCGALVWGQAPRLVPGKDQGTPRQPLPVVGAGVTVCFMGDVAETALELEFRNPHDRDLEAEFEMDLPEGAVVTGYALDIRGIMRDAVAVEKETARTAYESIKRRMIDPGIVEHQGGNRYRTRVYPVPAGGTRRLRLHYTETLSIKDGACSYKLPLDFTSPPEAFTCTLIHPPGRRPDWGKTPGLAFQTEAADKLVAAIRGTDPGVRFPAALLLSLPLVERPELFTDRATGAFFLSLPQAAAKEQARPDPETIHLVWDASLSGTGTDPKPALRMLGEWFSTLRRATVILHFLRNGLTPGGRFSIRDGHWDDLEKALATVHYDGALDLSALPRGIHSTPVVFVSDGNGSMGGTPPPMNAPLYVIRKGNHIVLEHAAYVSGGACLDPGSSPARALADSARKISPRLQGIDRAPQPSAPRSFETGLTGAPSDGVVHPWSAPATERPLQVCGILPRVPADIDLRFANDGGDDDAHTALVSCTSMQVPEGVIRRLEARHHLAMLEQQPSISRERITDHCKAHGLASPYTSLIVLERIEDYVEHGIRPPEGELRTEYDRILQVKRAGDQPLTRLRFAWASKLSWFRTTYPGVEAPLLDRLRQTDIWRKAMDSQFPPEQRPVEPLRTITGWLEETRRMLARKPSADQAADFNAWRKAIVELTTRGTRLGETPIPPLPKDQEIAVSVRGLVNTPGIITAKQGLTLREAIRQAGGISPVGSLDNVALYRNAGKVVYNTLSRAYQDEPLRPGDMIVVMQPHFDAEMYQGMDPFASSSDQPHVPTPEEQPAVRRRKSIWVGDDGLSGNTMEGLPDPSLVRHPPASIRLTEPPEPDFPAFDRALAGGGPAEAAYRDLTRGGLMNPRDYVEAARRLFAAKHPDLGRRVLSNLVAIRPHDDAALFTYALWLAEFGQTEEADRHLSCLVERHPGRCEFPLALSSVRSSAGNESGAREALAPLFRRITNEPIPSPPASIVLTELNACGWGPPSGPPAPAAWRYLKLSQNLPSDLRVSMTLSEGSIAHVSVREPVGTIAKPGEKPTHCGGMAESAPGLAEYAIREAIPGTHQILAAVDRPSTIRIAIHTRWGSPGRKTRILTRWVEPGEWTTLAEIPYDPAAK